MRRRFSSKKGKRLSCIVPLRGVQTPISLEYQICTIPFETLVTRMVSAREEEV